MQCRSIAFSFCFFVDLFCSVLIYEKNVTDECNFNCDIYSYDIDTKIDDDGTLNLHFQCVFFLTLNNNKNACER